MIVKSKLSHLETDMFYLEHFHWSTSATNELRYINVPLAHFGVVNDVTVDSLLYPNLSLLNTLVI